MPEGSASSNSLPPRRNPFGLVGVVCASSSLVIWVVLASSLLLFASNFSDELWPDQKDDLNELQSGIEFFSTFAVGGILGCFGVFTGGTLSLVAVVASGIGLAVQPRRMAVIGCVLGVLSAVPGFLYLIAVGTFVSSMPQ